jgi:predicted MFS family arabinose efflux permease
MASAAALGAFITDYFGFDTLFFIVGTLIVIGSLLLLAVRSKINSAEQ